MAVHDKGVSPKKKKVKAKGKGGFSPAKAGFPPAKKVVAGKGSKIPPQFLLKKKVKAGPGGKKKKK